MAAGKRKKKKKVIRFELTPAGFSGLAVVCFCVFLWMFLFGVWAGQTILLPSAGKVVKDRFAGDLSHRAGLLQRAVPKKEIKQEKLSLAEVTHSGGNGFKESLQEDDESYFCLQVNSMGNLDRAREAVLRWQAKGHDAFMLAPATEQGAFWRVFIGRFVSLAEANSQAALLEKEEGVKVYITLLSAGLIPLT